MDTLISLLTVFMFQVTAPGGLQIKGYVND